MRDTCSSFNAKSTEFLHNLIVHFLICISNLARALHRILSWRYNEEVWPKQTFDISQLISIIVKRINEASGIYQMFGKLADVILLNR